MTECKALLSDLYPHEMTEEEFQSTFSKIDHDRSMDFEYATNIESLRHALESWTRCPPKHDFCALMETTFGANSYAAILSETKTYDELNRESESKVILVQNIKEQFLQNVQRRGRCMAFVTVYIDDLWRWIEENGIPALHQLNERSNEHINQGIIEKYNNLCDEYTNNKTELHRVQHQLEMLQSERSDERITMQRNNAEAAELTAEHESIRKRHESELETLRMELRTLRTELSALKKINMNTDEVVEPFIVTSPSSASNPSDAMEFNLQRSSAEYTLNGTEEEDETVDTQSARSSQTQLQSVVLLEEIKGLKGLIEGLQRENERWNMQHQRDITSLSEMTGNIRSIVSGSKTTRNGGHGGPGHNEGDPAHFSPETQWNLDGDRILQYMKDHLVHKGDGDESGGNRLETMQNLFWFLLGVGVGYVAGKRLKRQTQHRLLGFGVSGVGVTIASVLGLRGHKRRGDVISASGGFLIGFAVALKR